MIAPCSSAATGRGRDCAQPLTALGRAGAPPSFCAASRDRQDGAARRHARDRRRLRGAPRTRRSGRPGCRIASPPTRPPSRCWGGCLGGPGAGGGRRRPLASMSPARRPCSSARGASRTSRSPWWRPPVSARRSGSRPRRLTSSRSRALVASATSGVVALPWRSCGTARGSRRSGSRSARSRSAGGSLTPPSAAFIGTREHDGGAVWGRCAIDAAAADRPCHL